MKYLELRNMKIGRVLNIAKKRIIKSTFVIGKKAEKLSDTAFWIRLSREIQTLIHRIFYYVRIWILMSRNSFMVVLSKKLLLFFFLTGKILRFSFFILFLYFLVSGTDSLAGYSVTQTIFFFLTFNLIDVTAQFLFREVYRFRPLLVSGDFDLILIKPFNSLFRVLMGGADVIDFITIPPLIFTLIYVGNLLHPTYSQIILYLFLLINGLLLSTGFHILAVSLAIITLEIDHTIMIYRDLTNLGKLPVDIYRQPIKGIITYLIPVGVMVTIPAKALMGLVNAWGVLVSFLLGIAVFILSKKFWNFAVIKYTSASS